MSALPPADGLRVLCIDGGGIKGYTALLILKKLFLMLQEDGNFQEMPKPCDIFDLIAGTSTGGLIAVMLGRLHMTIDECIAHYETVGAAVFDRRPSAVTKLLKGLAGSAFYNIRRLQGEIKKVLEARQISVKEPFLENSSPKCKV